MSTETNKSLPDETYKTLASRPGVIFTFSCSIQCQEWRENHDLKYDPARGITLNNDEDFSHGTNYDILELVEKLQDLRDKKDGCFDMPLKDGRIFGWHDFTYTDKGNISVKVTAILSPRTFIREYEGEVSARQADDLEHYGFALVFTDDGWIQMLAGHLPGIYTGKLACFKVFETMAQIIVMSTTSTIQEDQREYAQLIETFELSLKDAMRNMILHRRLPTFEELQASYPGKDDVNNYRVISMKPRDYEGWLWMFGREEGWGGGKGLFGSFDRSNTAEFQFSICTMYGRSKFSVGDNMSVVGGGGRCWEVLVGKEDMKGGRCFSGLGRVCSWDW